MIGSSRPPVAALGSKLVGCAVEVEEHSESQIEKFAGKLQSVFVFEGCRVLLSDEDRAGGGIAILDGEDGGLPDAMCNNSALAVDRGDRGVGGAPLNGGVRESDLAGKNRIGMA